MFKDQERLLRSSRLARSRYAPPKSTAKSSLGLPRRSRPNRETAAPLLEGDPVPAAGVARALIGVAGLMS
jgi:hypothetical protein